MRRLFLSFALLLLAFATQAQTEERTIGFLHVNDVYQIAPIDPATPRGGLARLATLAKQVRQKNPATLLLLGGDTISPSMESVLFKGKQMISAWNAVGLDASAFGNHEFDFGPEVLRERLSESRFPWLAANLSAADGQPLPNTQAGKIYDLNGIKVGIVGLITPDSAYLSKGGKSFVFEEVTRSASRAAAELRQQGAQVLVALTHVSLAQDRELASLGIFDLILGGHEHYMISEQVGRTPIFKAGSDARDALHIRLRFGPKGDDRLRGLAWDWIPIDKKLTEDAKVAEVAAGFERQLAARMGEVIGKTQVALDSRTANVRQRETNLANFIADSVRAATHADVALINGGSIRADRLTGPGPLSRRDIRTWLPFENNVVVLSIPGKILRQALEHGLNQVAKFGISGAMPQVSGLRLRYDASRPAGERILSITVGQQPLDENKDYRLATTSYLADGGDAYSMLTGLPVLVHGEGSPLDADMVVQAILQARTIAPKLDGRIERVR